MPEPVPNPALDNITTEHPPPWPRALHAAWASQNALNSLCVWRRRFPRGVIPTVAAPAYAATDSRGPQRPPTMSGTGVPDALVEKVD